VVEVALVVVEVALVVVEAALVVVEVASGVEVASMVVAVVAEVDAVMAEGVAVVVARGQVASLSSRVKGVHSSDRCGLSALHLKAHICCALDGTYGQLYML